MAAPWRVAIDASNKPNASQNYEHGTTALTGFQAPASVCVDGDTYTVIAEQVDGNGAPSGAWEAIDCPWVDSTTDYFDRVNGTLRASSTGSKIDWSTATGLDVTPRLRVLGRAGIVYSPRRILTHTFSGQASLDFATRASCSYLVMFEGLDFSDDQIDLMIRVAPSAGTFDSGATDYETRGIYQGSTASPTAAASTGDTGIGLFGTGNLFGNGGVNEEVSGQIWIMGARDSGTQTKVCGGGLITATYADTARYIVIPGGHRVTAQADVEIRLLVSAGTIDAGRIAVWEYPLGGGE